MHSDKELARRDMIFKLGCIVMEFMEDFIPLNDYFKKISYESHNKIYSFISYELSRLHSIGVIHGDIHYGNFMYNSKYKYITDGTNPQDLGRILIIDFGRSKDNMESQISELNDQVFYKYGENAVGEKWNNELYHFKFKKPYTFEYIYSKRLELTFKFRQTIINKTITDINQFITDHPSKIPIKELQKFKNSNIFKLAIALLKIKPLYPLNFATPRSGIFLDDFIGNLNKKEQKVQKKFNITKKINKIDKIKDKIPKQYYPDEDLGNVEDIPAMDLIELSSTSSMSSMSSMSKVKKTKNLEKISQLGFVTLKKLNTMVTEMFKKPKKGILIGGRGRGKNKLYHYLQYHNFTKKLNTNIVKQLKFYSKKYKELKKSKKNKTLI
jgi:tRNA A-37 threonylcarbamoyl transferase component Bud32